MKKMPPIPRGWKYMGDVTQFKGDKMVRLWHEEKTKSEWGDVRLIGGYAGRKDPDLKMWHAIEKTAERKKGQIKPKWSEWKTWNGGKSNQGPPEVGKYEKVMVKRWSGREYTDEKRHIDWKNKGNIDDVITYRTNARKKRKHETA